MTLHPMNFWMLVCPSVTRPACIFTSCREKVIFYFQQRPKFSEAPNQLKLKPFSD